jgi:NAD(P)-dependent dehydrogenase (short-subunit alcohol dehydrogenase family)
LTADTRLRPDARYPAPAGERLAGKIALITGAASDGIGRAIAVAFAREGADVAMLDNRDGAETVALVEREGRQITALPVDVSDPDEVRAGVARTLERFGQINVLVNCAATITRKPFLEIELADWDLVHSVNLRGTFIVAQAVAREMVRAGNGGSIVNVASTGGMKATVGQAHYCAAKAGVIMLTKSMAVELAPLGIRVNAVSPGTIETDINRHLLADAEFRARKGGGNALGRVGLPTELVGAALLLASDESTFMTGANVVVDGGSTAY